MKKLIRWALAFGLCLSLLVCGAAAAQAADIAVQLDGQDLAFTDAVPQVLDQRTFLPFRAVFEAMGAEVDNKFDVITAVRGDKTLIMTIGSDQATVIDGGVTRTIQMDVAPYVDPTTWRTYVPVRFAAQAFGCVVGWDQEAQTAIVIDVDKLLDQALEGKRFTCLEQLAALDGKYDEGIWDMTGKMDMDVSISFVTLLDADVDITGTAQDAEKMSMDMDMKLDMDALVQMLGAMSGETTVSAEDQAVLDALKTDGISMSMRGDMAQGKLYMNMDMGALNSAAEGFDPNAWYKLDMDALMEQSGISGMDWAALLEQTKDMDYMDLIKALLSAGEGNSAAGSYTDLKAEVETLTTLLSDQGFQATSDGKLVAACSIPLADVQLDFSFTLDMEGEAVKGYAVDLSVTGTDKETQDSVSLTAYIAVDDQDKVTVKADITFSDIAVSMDLDAAYTPGAAAPVTTPPADATVFPFADLMAQAEE